MSKQEAALKHWENQKRLDRITELLVVARDFSFPAGQVQVSIQMATVEIPWLLNYIEELKEHNAGQGLEKVA